MDTQAHHVGPQRRQKKRGSTTDEMGWPTQKTCGWPMVQKCERQSVVERTWKKTLTLPPIEHTRAMPCSKRRRPFPFRDVWLNSLINSFIHSCYWHCLYPSPKHTEEQGQLDCEHKGESSSTWRVVIMAVPQSRYLSTYNNPLWNETASRCWPHVHLSTDRGER